MRSLTLTGCFVLSLLPACRGPSSEPIAEQQAPIVGDDARLDDIHNAVVAVSGGGRLCTGTVIARSGDGDSFYVLTAAHCCRRPAPPERVRVGADASDPARSFPVANFRQHPCYNPLSHDYDFCVLEVADKGSLNVTPIPPASAPDDLSSGSTVTFVGYGSTPAVNVSRRRVQSTLREVGPLTMSADQTHDQGGICFGDSGGPALIEQGGKEVVAGVSSFGAPSALCNAVGVAGRVSERAVRAEFIDKMVAGQEPTIADVLILRTGASPGQVRDTTIQSDDPDQENGKGVELLTGGPSSALRRTLLRFDLSAIPAGANVVSASMGLHLESRTGPQRIGVHRVTKAWDEERETWSSFGRAGFDREPVATFLNDTAVVDMTDEVWFEAGDLARAWLSGRMQNHGVALVAEGQDETQFLSSEIGRMVERPWMHVCYLPAAP